MPLVIHWASHEVPDMESACELCDFVARYNNVNISQRHCAIGTIRVKLGVWPAIFERSMTQFLIKLAHNGTYGYGTLARWNRPPYRL